MEDGPKILIIEDNEDWRRIIAASLQEAEYQVLAVSGAAEAALQKDMPGLGLIVLDLDLGGENGLMLMKHLKRQHPDTPILVYTGMEPDARTVQQMRDQGATLFMRKGAMGELVDAVRKIVGPRDAL